MPTLARTERPGGGDTTIRTYARGARWLALTVAAALAAMPCTGAAASETSATAAAASGAPAIVAGDIFSDDFDLGDVCGWSLTVTLDPCDGVDDDCDGMYDEDASCGDSLDCTTDMCLDGSCVNDPLVCTTEGASCSEKLGCQCQMDEADCSGTCQNVATDVSNCGACAVFCGNNESCSGGSCACADEMGSPGGGPVCSGGAPDCCPSSGCANLAQDFQNCGGCDAPCDPITSDNCQSGTCRCGSEPACAVTETCVKGVCIPGA